MISEDKNLSDRENIDETPSDDTLAAMAEAEVFFAHNFKGRFDSACEMLDSIMRDDGQ